VSELGLRKEEDDVPPRKGDVIGNGTVLAWHGTLEKLTLPHDANSVVQNKKGKTKPNQGRNPHAQEGNTRWLTALPFLAAVCALRGDVFSRLSLEYSYFRIDSTPTSQFALNGSVCAHETTDEL